MKASEFIKIVRDDFGELYELHKLAVATDGKEGLLCLNPEHLIEKISLSDREILEFYVKQGAVIDDVEEYLARADQ